MQQESLFHEDIYDALRTCVQALGGAKRVGSLLWPEVSADKAGNRLNDALNTARREVLNPEQVLLIMAEARKVDCHAAMQFITRDCNYQDPIPVEPLDEMAELQRQFVQSQRQLAQMLKRMEHLSGMKVGG